MTATGERVGYDTTDTSAAPADPGAIRAIARRWPLVLVVTLAAVAAAVLVSSLRDDSYSADVRMLITPIAQQDERFLGTDLIRDSGDAARTAATVAESLDSREIDGVTARRLGDDWTASEVHDAVTVKALVDANVVEVTARATSGDLAARVATTYAQATLDVRWTTIAAQLDQRLAALEQLQGSTSDEGGIGRDREVLATVRRAGEDPTIALQPTAPDVSETGVSTPVLAVLALLGGLVLGGLAALAMSRAGGGRAAAAGPGSPAGPEATGDGDAARSPARRADLVSKAH